jgi:hypothetical protein
MKPSAMCNQCTLPEARKVTAISTFTAHLNVSTAANQYIDWDVYWNNVWTDSVRQTSSRLYAQELQVQLPMADDEIEIKLRYTFSRQPFLELFQDEDTACIVLPSSSVSSSCIVAAWLHYGNSHTPDFLIS